MIVVVMVAVETQRNVSGHVLLYSILVCLGNAIAIAIASVFVSFLFFVVVVACSLFIQCCCFFFNIFSACSIYRSFVLF